MKILRDEMLKEAREFAEKQKRLREREEKREAKKKEAEAKKKTREQRKNRKQIRKNAQQEMECDENNCKICLAQYMLTDDEDLPRVLCEICNMWIHIECVSHGVDLSPIDNDEPFFCHDCI